MNPPTTPDVTTILALDVGEKRIGIARSSSVAKIAAPLVTLSNGPVFFNELKQIILNEAAELIVVGLPRSLDGNPTYQTAYIKEFVSLLKKNTELPIVYQDEALTSVKAKEELDARGKDYKKADVDALAACYILEDYLSMTRV